MTLQTTISQDKAYYMNTFGDRLPVSFERGEGMYIYSSDGIKYTDLFGGIAVSALGHSHPVLTAALHDQVDKLLHTSSLYYVENQALLAMKIVESSCCDRVFFSSTGAEANEGAIKLARMCFYKQGITHKNEIITLKDSFHGRTLTTVAATGQDKYQQPYRPLMPSFIHVERNDIEALKNAVTDNTCAIILEVIQGESGVHPTSAEYLQFARELCDEKGIILIFDEVQTGMGRTGKLFGYQLHGVEPDIFTLAKALGGGVPIGAVCAKEAFCAFTPGDHGTTFGGNPLATRAGLAVFEAYEKENLVDNAHKMGLYFKDKLLGLKSDKITEIRGSGLMIGIELSVSAKEINKKLFESGYLCGVVGENTLRLLPPLIITEDVIDGFIEVLKSII